MGARVVLLSQRGKPTSIQGPQQSLEWEIFPMFPSPRMSRCKSSRRSTRRRTQQRTEQRQHSFQMESRIWAPQSQAVVFVASPLRFALAGPVSVSFNFSRATVTGLGHCKLFC